MSKGLNKKDENAFLFSVDLQKIYRPHNVEKAVGHWNDYGPVFGDSSLTLKKDMK